MTGPDAVSGPGLGRYAAGTADGDEVVEVRLLGTPLELVLAAREHHDGLMREFRMMALSGRLTGAAAPSRLAELTEILGRRYGTAAERRDADVDDALDRGARTLDLVQLVPPSAADGAAALAALMAEADAYCAAEQLMTLERPPLLKQFATWYLEQFVVQCAGGHPVPWDGPLALPEDRPPVREDRARPAGQ